MQFAFYVNLWYNNVTYDFINHKLAHLSKKMENIMAKQNQTKDGKGNGSRAKKERTVAKVETPAKAKKQKTPAGHFRFNGKVYPLRTEGMPTQKLYCKSCGAENAKVLGLFLADDCTYYYVVKCPHHPDNVHTLSEEKFRRIYPGVLPEQELPLVTPEGYPLQCSYCKNCLGTTAEVIGESKSRIAWKVKCPICGATWCENKDRFAEKYIGVDGNPPLYPQREPKPLSEWHDARTDNPISDQLAHVDFPKERAASPTVEPAKNEQASNPPQVETPDVEECNASKPDMAEIQVNGVSFFFPKGMPVNIGVRNGIPVVSLS